MPVVKSSGSCWYKCFRIISTHLPLLKIMCMEVKALRLRWKSRIDILRLRVLHGWDSERRVKTSQLTSLGQERFHCKLQLYNSEYECP